MSDKCMIKKSIKRASKELVNLFKDIPVSIIDDCMGRVAAMHARIRPMNMARLLGTAFTVRVPDGDNLMLHKAIDMAEPGDVILIDAGGYDNRSIFGEIISTYCKQRGIAGLVVDGCIRDVQAIAEMEDFPVYAIGITPNGPFKNGPGTINATINIGGIIVHPGDIVVGDADGVVVIKPDEAEIIAQTAHEIMKKEHAILQTIVDRKEYSRPWVDQKIDQIGYALD